jgi:hypothetical protein
MNKAGWMGRAVRPAVVAALALTLGLAGAVGLTGCSSSDEAVRTEIAASIDSDFAQLQNLTSDVAADVLASDFVAELQAAGVDPAAVAGPLFAELTYTVGDVTVDGDQATVQLTVTNRDLNTALQLYTATVTNELASTAGRDALAALSDVEVTAHMADLLVQAIEDPSVSLVTSTVELVYQQDGTSWVLQNGDELSVALMGGLDPSVASEVTDAQISSTADAAAAAVASITPQSEETEADAEQPVDAAEQPAEA